MTAVTMRYHHPPMGRLAHTPIGCGRHLTKASSLTAAQHGQLPQQFQSCHCGHPMRCSFCESAHSSEIFQSAQREAMGPSRAIMPTALAPDLCLWALPGREHGLTPEPVTPFCFRGTTLVIRRGLLPESKNDIDLVMLLECKADQ